MSKKKRIFLGFTEVANFINTYRKGFEAIGYNTYSVVDCRNKYYPTASYDVVLSELDKRDIKFEGFIGKVWQAVLKRAVIRLYFFKALFTCDIFYYISGGNVLPFQLDYLLIRLFRKKLVVVFLGSDVRHWYLYKVEMDTLGYSEVFSVVVQGFRKQTSSLAIKESLVRAAEKYANLILSQAGYAQLQSKPYCRTTVGLFLSEYGFEVPGRERPLIVHAPSSRGLKGTKFIIEALEKLKREGLHFEFRLIENMANEDLIKLLISSDIVIDELYSDTIGVLSAEAMATGNAVLTGYISELAGVPLPCPVVNTNQLNVYENVKKLILDLDYRKNLAHLGRPYVETHNDITKTALREVTWLEMDEDIRKYDFIPHFDSNIILPDFVLTEEKSKGY